MYGFIFVTYFDYFFTEILDLFGNFWSSLWELMDSKLKKNTPLHPQTYDQTKVLNKKYCISFKNIVVSILNFGMSICITSNMPRIVPSIHLHKYLHLKFI